MKICQAIIILAVLSISLFTGCSAGKTQLRSDNLQEYFPDWWKTQPEDDYIYSYGLAVKIDESASLEAAKANAMLSAPEYIETYLQKKLNKYVDEAGVKDPQLVEISEYVLKTVSDSRFGKIATGMTENVLVRTPEGERHKVFLQLMIPTREINKSLINQIRNQEILYNQFLESKTFKELDDSLQ